MLCSKCCKNKAAGYIKFGNVFYIICKICGPKLEEEWKNKK